MTKPVVSTDRARVLAELVDTALADDWAADEPAMALLWRGSADPDDLRIAVKRLQRSMEDELAPLADGRPYLAVAHSAVTGQPPVRVTVAVDHGSDSGVLRHRNGATEWFGAVDLPVAKLVRSLLRLAPL